MVRNEWSHTAIPFVCVQGVDRENFITLYHSCNESPSVTVSLLSNESTGCSLWSTNWVFMYVSCCLVVGLWRVQLSSQWNNVTAEYHLRMNKWCTTVQSIVEVLVTHTECWTDQKQPTHVARWAVTSPLCKPRQRGLTSALGIWLTHCGRVTHTCVFNTVKLGTSASSP